MALFLASCGRKGVPTLKSFEKPEPVREIKVVHMEDEVIITWSYPSSEREKIKGFYIEKAEGSPNFTAPPLLFQKNDSSGFTDKGFKLKKEYFYRIRAYSLRDVLSDDSPVVSVKPLPLYEPPTGLSYVLTNEKLKIQWDRVCNSIRYNIYKSYEKGKYRQTPLNSAPLEATFIYDKIDTKKPVYYSVRALHDTAVRDEGYPSAELEVDPKSFVPTKPSGMKYVIGQAKVYLMWLENPETWVAGYRIYRKRSPENEFRLIGEAVTPAFTDSERLTAASLYYVTALGPEKEGSPSSVIEVTPLVER